MERDKLGRFTFSGGEKTHKGYKVVYMPDHPHARANGYVYAHIIAMEAAIGRHLADGEVVHHIDGNKRNNSPDNLMLFRNNREHTKHHWIERSKKYAISTGDTVSIPELADIAGISYSTAYQRIKKLGWTADEVISGKRSSNTTEGGKHT